MRTKILAAPLAVALSLPLASLALSDPPNDARDDARKVTRLPTLIGGTTKDAKAGPSDNPTCAETAGSVWYRVDPGRSRRIVARLEAGGDLDAVLDVYVRERSQHHLLTCDVSDRNGRAAVAFPARRGQSYLIRVARRADSVSGDFKLRLEGAGGPRLPGPPLPPGGISGSLDRVQRTAQAWSVRFRRGVRYRIRLVPPRSGCVRASVYKAGVRPSPFREPLARTNCHGNALFTPRPGQGTRFSIFVNAAGGVRGRQRYHLQAAPAGRDDSAPGRFVPNYARLDGVLDAGSVDALDLFRFDVTRRSVLFLHLRSPDAQAAHDLVLLDAFGNVLRCTCGGLGSAELRKGLRPGRYFIAARARGRSSAPYTLLRASRTITKTFLRVDGAGQTVITPGRSATVSVRTEPPVSGPVTVTFEQFDPLTGWQFARRMDTTAVNGQASVDYAPPTEGRWRATAEYDGTRGSAPSEANNFVEILVARPLRE